MPRLAQVELASSRALETDILAQYVIIHTGNEIHRAAKKEY